MSILGGLDILAGPALYLLASSQIQYCSRTPPLPEITVGVQEQPVRIRSDMSMEELSRFDITAEDHRARFHAAVGGVTDGNVTLDHRIVFAQALDRGTGFGCLHFSRIEIVLTLEPVIYIASDYGPYSCWHHEVQEHELEHVEIDRALLKKYESRIKDGLYMVYGDPAEYSSGVVTEWQMLGLQQRMKVDMEQSIAVLFNNMQRERQLAHQALDTPEEYQRIREACAGE